MKKNKYGQKKKPTTIAKWFGRITIKKKLIITAAVFLGLMGTSISLQLISSSNTSVNISENAGAMMKENSQKNVEENLKRLTFNIAQFVVSMETELGKTC
ncbi:MAG: hypothetical protein SA378_06630 [Sedimentibacter sp.]|uniref:hypothetical protein n=1 Tax=Sedimentibacter sp. TaxID=1960295 RepID=UPI0029811730|nr:hypothetical protein [Sedimentibacter sp.]MDW5299792.1 hypothetical protein [Sedimentibacter sp.]